MKIRLFFFCLLLLFLHAMHTDFAFGENMRQVKEPSGVYLEPGVGLEGQIEIGKPLTMNEKEMEALEERYGFKVATEEGTNSNIVGRIRCSKPGCVTDKNISVGADAAKLLKRFGPPIRTVEKGKVKGSEVIHIYQGVAFKVKKYVIKTKVGQEEKHKIDTIFILPLSVGLK